MVSFASTATIVGSIGWFLSLARDEVLARRAAVVTWPTRPRISSIGCYLHDEAEEIA